MIGMVLFHPHPSPVQTASHKTEAHFSDRAKSSVAGNESNETDSEAMVKGGHFLSWTYLGLEDPKDHSMFGSTVFGYRDPWGFMIQEMTVLFLSGWLNHQLVFYYFSCT